MLILPPLGLCCPGRPQHSPPPRYGLVSQLLCWGAQKDQEKSQSW